MGRSSAAPGQDQAAAIRLRLEVSISHEDAIAAVRAGYLTAAEIAAADDDEFVRAVRLPRSRSLAVLAVARAPGSHVRGPGKPPRLMREGDVGAAVGRAAAPVRRVVAKAVSSRPARPAPAPRPAPSGPKPPPPHASSERARRRPVLDDAAEAERDLDAALDETAPDSS